MINQDTYTGASFSLRNRAGRVVWSLVYAIFFRFSPKPMHRWRSFLLRCFGAKIGKGVHVYPGVKVWAPWNLKIGDESGVGDGANLYTQANITIGVRCVISQGVYLCTGTHDYTKPGFPLIANSIQIGDHVWLAAESFVHPGVTIATGCVVGARSVVVKDLPQWMVCSGYPCKPLKVRVLTQEK